MKVFKKLLPIVLVLCLVFSPAAFATVGDTVAKNDLSGSTNGTGILVVATATAGTLIHTAVTGTTNFDEVWIWAHNTHTAAVNLTIEYGGVTDPNHLIQKTIPIDDGLYLVIPGLILQNSLVIRAFASVASKVVIYGYVHEMTE